MNPIELPIVKVNTKRSLFALKCSFLRYSYVISLSALAIIPIQISLAQTPPDAGSLQQQIDRARKPQLPQRASPDRPAEPPVMPAQSGIVTTVKSFRFAGNTLLTTEQLAPVVFGYLNRPLDYAELQAAAAAVAKAYRDAGWIVRAYLPRQDITDGVVTIQIVEAVFGGVQYEGTNPSRIKMDTLLGMFERQQRKGELLNTAALDRALLLTDDLPGVVVAGSLKSGASERETDLVLKLGDEPLATGDISIDNYGSRSTGSDRLSANINLNSALGRGDLFNANLIHTQGSDMVRISATAPVGLNGLRMGVNTSHLGYHLVTADFSALDASGTSDTAGLELLYPMIRSRLKNLYLNLNFDHKSFDNRSSGATTTNYSSQTATIGLNGNLFDNLGGGGANSANLGLVTGSLNLDNSPNKAADAASTKAAGQFNKLRYAISRQQVITENVAVFGSLTGQWADKNLDSSEKFFLGGPNGIRAYPNSEGGGSIGKLASFELRWRVKESFSLTGSYDYGCVSQNQNSGFTGAAVPNDYCLKGPGVALAWQSGNGPSAKLTWAHRDGGNPNPTAAGNDQDGSFTENRIWLLVSQQF